MVHDRVPHDPRAWAVIGLDLSQGNTGLDAIIEAGGVLDAHVPTRGPVGVAVDIKVKGYPASVAFDSADGVV